MEHPLPPALGLIELCSVAKGLTVCDAVAKRAKVQLVKSTPVHPGKYIVLFRGGVDETWESMDRGCAVAGETLVDRVFLPNPHPGLNSVLVDAINLPVHALGILETFSAAAALRGADAALKGGEIAPLRLRLADDLGGKAYFIFTGLLHSIESAMAAGCDAAGSALVAGSEIIANPHPDVLGALD